MPSFELDRARTGPDELGGVLYRGHGCSVETQPWHVGHKDRAMTPIRRSRRGDAAGDSSRVVSHVWDRKLQRVVVPEYDHGKGVAHEHEVSPTLRNHASRWRVVGGDHHERFDTVTYLPAADC